MQNTKLIKKISTSLVSTGEIIDSLQSNSSTNAPSIRAVVNNMTPPMNLLINGDFQIWQRGESFTIEGDEAFHYTADMWCVYAGAGQTITVNKTTDGLQFSGASVIMQRMNPLEVGKNYIFLCKVDGDFKTLSITGGTYTENSFLKYNKTGSYEQLQIKSNGITNVANARLWEGDTVYKIVKEDDAIALMRCKYWVRRFSLDDTIVGTEGSDSPRLNAYPYVGGMYEAPSITMIGDNKKAYFIKDGAAKELGISSITLFANSLYININGTLSNFSVYRFDSSLRLYFIASCEPL